MMILLVNETRLHYVRKDRRVGFMETLRELCQKHRNISWIILLSYITFFGCFVFPFSNELFPFDLDKGIMVASSYGIIGLGFAVLLEKHRNILVLSISFIFTIIGLGLRYVIEYGEVSNVMNFIPINIALYVIIIPVYCMIVYRAIYRFKIK